MTTTPDAKVAGLETELRQSLNDLHDAREVTEPGTARRVAALSLKANSLQVGLTRAQLGAAASAMSPGAGVALAGALAPTIAGAGGPAAAMALAGGSPAGMMAGALGRAMGHQQALCAMQGQLGAPMCPQQQAAAAMPGGAGLAAVAAAGGGPGGAGLAAAAAASGGPGGAGLAAAAAGRQPR